MSLTGTRKVYCAKKGCGVLIYEGDGPSPIGCPECGGLNMRTEYPGEEEEKKDASPASE